MQLDLLAARAWPPLEEERIDGWRLRFSRGMTSRQVSAAAWPPGPADVLRARGYTELKPTLVLTGGTRDWHSSGTDLARAWHRDWFFGFEPAGRYSYFRAAG
jgi:hypothetical protein